MKKINVLLITTVSMFAFAAQAMKHRIDTKEKGKKYRQSLIDRRIYIRNGVTSEVNKRRMNLQRKNGHQKLVYAISRRTNPKRFKVGQLRRGNLAPKSLKPVMDEQGREDVRNEQVRRCGLAFLQNFTAANADFLNIHIRLNRFRTIAPDIIAELIRTGNGEVVPYILRELN